MIKHGNFEVFQPIVNKRILDATTTNNKAEKKTKGFSLDNYSNLQVLKFDLTDTQDTSNVEAQVQKISLDSVPNDNIMKKSLTLETNFDISILLLYPFTKLQSHEYDVTTLNTALDYFSRSRTLFVFLVNPIFLSQYDLAFCSRNKSIESLWRKALQTNPRNLVEVINSHKLQWQASILSCLDNLIFKSSHFSYFYIDGTKCNSLSLVFYKGVKAQQAHSHVQSYNKCAFPLKNIPVIINNDTNIYDADVYCVIPNCTQHLYDSLVGRGAVSLMMYLEYNSSLYILNKTNTEQKHKFKIRNNNHISNDGKQENGPDLATSSAHTGNATTSTTSTATSASMDTISGGGSSRSGGGEGTGRGVVGAQLLSGEEEEVDFMAGCTLVVYGEVAIRLLVDYLIEVTLTFHRTISSSLTSHNTRSSSSSHRHDPNRRDVTWTLPSIIAPCAFANSSSSTFEVKSYTRPVVPSSTSNDDSLPVRSDGAKEEEYGDEDASDSDQLEDMYLDGDVVSNGNYKYTDDNSSDTDAIDDKDKYKKGLLRQSSQEKYVLQFNGYIPSACINDLATVLQELSKMYRCQYVGAKKSITPISRYSNLFENGIQVVDRNTYLNEIVVKNIFGTINANADDVSTSTQLKNPFVLTVTGATNTFSTSGVYDRMLVQEKGKSGREVTKAGKNNGHYFFKIKCSHHPALLSCVISQLYQQSFTKSNPKQLENRIFVVTLVNGGTVRDTHASNRVIVKNGNKAKSRNKVPLDFEVQTYSPPMMMTYNCNCKFPKSNAEDVVVSRLY